MILLGWIVTLFIPHSLAQVMDRRVGKFQEVFAWRQLTYNINGIAVVQDRVEGIKEIDENVVGQGEDDRFTFDTRQVQTPSWDHQSLTPNPYWTNWKRPNTLDSGSLHHGYSTGNTKHPNSWQPVTNTWTISRPTQTSNPEPTNSFVAPPRSNEGSGNFFIQYNNVPMGVEKVGNRLFITVPRRRYGIPSTLNYIDLTENVGTRSPPLRPYPNVQASRSLVSVYRTRADECNRLWMVDTGLLEIPNASQQVQPPAIVVFHLETSQQILRYQFKSSDIPATNTPTGLASITIDIQNDCSNACAYIPDLTTFGLIVYSLKENDSWRLSHNFFHFNPTAGVFNVAGQRFMWNDGIFSVTLASSTGDNKIAYFHPLVSFQEFSVSTSVLKNKSITNDNNYWEYYSVVGERGANSQSTMHGIHQDSNVAFFADVGRDAVSCWNSGQPLTPANVAVLARDSQRLSYPSDLHVTGDEVWVMANSLPRFAYSNLDTSEYNFFVYRANVQDLISGTVCDKKIVTG